MDAEAGTVPQSVKNYTHIAGHWPRYAYLYTDWNYSIPAMPRRPASSPDPLTRREREMMDIVYAAGGVTAREIQGRMADPPTDATVRTILRVLERKGHVRRRALGKAYVYEAVRPATAAARTAVRRLVEVFFGGSVERAVSGLLDASQKPLTAEELDRLGQLIRDTKTHHPTPPPRHDQ